MGLNLKLKVKKVLLSRPMKICLPPLLYSQIKRLFQVEQVLVDGKRKLQVASESDYNLEFIDYYGNTSLFALDCLKDFGPLNELRLLSIGCRMAHLIDYIALFKSVYHNTTVDTSFPIPVEGFGKPVSLNKGDLFNLPKLDIDCIISHGVFHCVDDKRYHNDLQNNQSRRPYIVAGKLREIIGTKKIPIIVSIAVNEEDYFGERFAFLAHEKFVQSFADAGFKLQNYFFDYLCDGMPVKKEHFEHTYRRTQILPGKKYSELDYVHGNYFFL